MLLLFLPQPHAGLAVVEKFYPGFLKRPHHERERAGARSDFAVEGFHAADGSYRHARPLRKLNLFHAEEHARRAQLSSRDQPKTVPRVRV